MFGTSHVVQNEVLVLGLLVVVCKIPYSSCMWTRQDVIGVFQSHYYNVCACYSPVYHYIAATVVYLVQRIVVACAVVILFYKKSLYLSTKE